MIFLIKKKDGKARPVIDYRSVNAGTNTEPFPPLDADEIFDRLAGAEWYAVADLTCGYWQMEIEEASRKFTAFTTRDGHFQFRRVPFGLPNAAGSKERCPFLDT